MCGDWVESHVSDCVPIHRSQPLSHTYLLNDYNVVLSVVKSLVNGNYSPKITDLMLTIWSHWAQVSLTTGITFDTRQLFGTRKLTVTSVIIFIDNRANSTF